MPESDKLIIISNHFHVTMDYLMKDESVLDENPSDLPVAENRKKPQSVSWAGFISCAFGLVGLIIWGLITIFQPAAEQKTSESSAITINGSGILLLFCIVTFVVGTVLLLKRKNKLGGILVKKHFVMSGIFSVFAIILSNVMSVVVAYKYCDMLYGIEYRGYSAPAELALVNAIPFLVGIVLCVILAIAFQKRLKHCDVDNPRMFFINNPLTKLRPSDTIMLYDISCSIIVFLF